MNSRTGLRVAKLGAPLSFAWSLFHVGVAHDIYLKYPVPLLAQSVRGRMG
jgi:hypothetical protein